MHRDTRDKKKEISSIFPLNVQLS